MMTATFYETAGPVTKSGPVMTEQSQQEREHDSVQSIEGQVMYQNMRRYQTLLRFAVNRKIRNI